MDADEVIALLGLAPHPEGGCFRETFRDPSPSGHRGAQTAIYYLLRAGEVSAWHRVTDASEVFHFYAGAPFELTLAAGPERTVIRLGHDLAAGEQLQAAVPAGIWQTSRSLGAGEEWSLIGCTVAPAFEFASFEMGPAGWEPG